MDLEGSPMMRYIDISGSILYVEELDLLRLTGHVEPALEV